MIFIASASYVTLEFDYLFKAKSLSIEFNEMMENNKVRRVAGAFMSVVIVFFMTSVL